MANRERRDPPESVDCHLSKPALIVVDLQNGDAHDDSDYVRRKTKELGEAARAYFLERLGQSVIPNALRLLAAFRERDLPVVYARIQSLTADGRDRGAGHKERAIHFPPGSWDGQILVELQPESNDVVVSKTAGSAFVGTGLDDILSNLGAEDLVVLGAITGSCVKATVLDGIRRRRAVVAVVDDACVAWAEEQHRDALEAMRADGARVLTTDCVIAAIS